MGGVRAAMVEPELARWRRLLEEAQVQGAVAAVDPHVPQGRPRPTMVDLLPDAHLYVVDPRAHVALAVADGSCDAVVLGPAVGDLPEPTRATLLDEAHRVLRPGGHLVVVVPTTEHRPWVSFTPPQWEPGTPPGWWSDALGERFEEVSHAPVSRWYDVLLAERREVEVPDIPGE
jgi:SAM-dependent methyltransferase